RRGWRHRRRGRRRGRAAGCRARAAGRWDGATGGDRLPVERLSVGRHRHTAAALQVAGHRAALRLEAVAGHRRRDLLVRTGAGVEEAAVAIATHRLVIVTGAVGGDGLVVGARLVAGHRLVVAALDVLRGAARLRAGVATRVRGGAAGVAAHLE